jgi:hypothetical protein
VVIKVLPGTLASHDGLYTESKHGEHGKPAVLDLLVVVELVVVDKREVVVLKP